MCSGFFSCMDQKQITFQKNITALGELLAQEESGSHSASQVLTLADALSRAVPGTAGNQRELCEATNSLYEAACDLLDDSDSRQCWTAVHRNFLRTHAAFSREMEKLRRSCGMVDLPAI